VPATITYRTLPHGVPAGETLKVEFYDSALMEWVLLEAVAAPGGYPTEWTESVTTTPPGAIGDYFALRFTSAGHWGGSSDKWYLDDVTITASEVAVPGDGTPSALRLERVYPNPFNPRVTIAFSSERTAGVRVTVCDAAGNLVAVLADRLFSAGRHELIWGGRNHAGLMMASGTYLLRLEGDGIVDVRKLMLVK